MNAYRHRLVFAAACAGMLLFGIALTTLGAVLPSIIQRLGLDRTGAGSLLALMSLGILAGSVVFGPVVDRRGYKGMLLAGAVLVALGLEGIAFAPSIALLAGSAILIGFGGGVINGGTTVLVADISVEGRAAGLAYLGVFFGIGAFGMPLVLGLLRERFGDAEVVAGIGALVLPLLAYYTAIRFPEPKQPQEFPLRNAARLFRDPVLVLLGVALFFESGMEITVGGWTATYVSEELALPPERALYLLSLYWLGMTGGRLVLGWLLPRVSSSAVLLVSLGVAFAGALILIGARTTGAAGAGTLLTGVGFAAVFPVILGHVGDRYERMSGTAFGAVLVMALMGGTALPYVTGVLGDAFGLRVSLAIVPAGLVCVASIFLVARPRLRTPPTVGG
ncbi:MAG: MFS transporter [Gemmatimonadota bacterium]|nr:MFS transporter [Gemmatimonadota bacterium]